MSNPSSETTVAIALAEIASTAVSALTNVLKQTHAGVVLVGASLLDQGLVHELKKKMRPLNADLHNRIFESYGPLNSFAAKIDLCLALDLISKATYDDLRNVNKIRVAFAHSTKIQSLNDPKLSDLLFKVVVPTGKDHYTALFVKALEKIRGDIVRHQNGSEVLTSGDKS